MCPIPKARKLVMTPPRLLPANHIPILVGISSRVYHMLVMYTNAGDMVASATPNKKRTVIRPPKLLHAAVRATTAPQKRVLIDTYLPTGRRWMSIVVGYSQKRYPK
jgi:hypothetical protein